MKTTLLLGLTTTWGSDWRAKVKEIDEFKIEEIALFVTALAEPERQELYKLLESTSLKYIHHTHLREQDMSEDEIEYLSNKWNCHLYNLHPTTKSIETIAQLPKYQKQIFIENTGREMSNLANNFEDIVKQSAGLCLDITHWQDYGIIQKQPGYQDFENIINKYPIGCAHISAITESLDSPRTIDLPKDYNRHTYRSLDQFDYVKDFVKYLPAYTSLELENSFAEQLVAKEYLEKLINSVT